MDTGNQRVLNIGVAPLLRELLAGAALSLAVASHSDLQILVKVNLEFPSVDISTLQVGDALTCSTSKVLLSPTGDTQICLDIGQHLVKGHRFQTLYAFVVSAEATLVFLILNLVLGAVVALLLKL